MNTGHRNQRAARLILLLGLWAMAWTAAVASDTQPTTNDVWWSLKPVVRPNLPDGAALHPVDRFIDAQLQVNQLKAVGTADRITLLRRVHLDLTGIPPTPAEQEAFLSDTSPDAYEKVVDRLLADEQHAVRYARHWLDVMRYADADERMTAAPGIHLWRDWVIQALHDDLPYNQFVQVQLTGLRSSERTQMSATGYRSKREPRPGDQFALGLLARGTGEDPQDLAINAVDTVSTAFMGMTVGCAKCHDHMYDPISQVNYYEMKALFDPLVLRKINLASAADLLANGKAQAESERRRRPFDKAVNDFAAPYRTQLYEERVVMLPPEAQVIIRKPEKLRTVAEQKIADDYFPILRIDGDKLTEAMPEEARKQFRELERQRDAANSAANSRRPPPLPAFHTVEVDRVREQQKSYILTSGDPLRPEPGKEVKPGWPFSNSEPDFREGRIEAFTDWLTAPENPLFARVAVNRMWQWHFGEGLLKTTSDFGKFGGLPSHPALLDWLASEFVRSGFSMKHLHRLMVTSHAYRRASETGAQFAGNLTRDPDNAQLWHFRLRRLEAEPIWDSIHAAVGDLDLKVGGPSFDPGSGGSRNQRRNGEGGASDGDSIRRGIYMVRGYSASREVTPNFLQTFDVEDGRAPCPLRTRTVTAPQALFLMNSPDIDKASIKLGQRLREEIGDDLTAAVNMAYRRVLSRPPSLSERTEALAWIGDDDAHLDRLSWLLFNLDEFIYVR